jgi:tetratricopeptide (TPR) repeat protein
MLKSRWLILFPLICFGCASLKHTQGHDHASLPYTGFEKDIEYNYALTEATRQKMFGNFKEAVGLYNKCIQTNSKSACSYFELANIFSYAGNISQAVNFSKNAYQLEPENSWYALQLCELYQKAGSIDSAEKFIKHQIKYFGPNRSYNYKLIEIEISKKRYSIARRLIKNSETLFGLNERLVLLDIKALKEQHKLNDAVKAANSLILRDNSEVRFLGMMAELYDSFGKTDSAEKYYLKMVDLEPNFETGQFSYLMFLKNSKKIDSFLTRSHAFINCSDYSTTSKMDLLKAIINDDKFVQNFTNTISLLIESYAKYDSTSLDFYANKYEFLVRTEKFKEAKVYILKIGEKTEPNLFYYLQLFELYRILGDFEAIIDQSLKLPSSFRDNSKLQLYYALSLSALNKDTMAIVSCEKLSSSFSTDRSLRYECFKLLGDLYYRTGDYKKAFNSFQQALDINTHELLVLNNYSYYLALNKVNLSKAKRMSCYTIRKEPENFMYLDTYGWILYQMGRFDKALKYLQKAFDLSNGTDPDIMNHLGDVFYKLNRKEEAFLYWKRAFPNKQINEILKEKKLE